MKNMPPAKRRREQYVTRILEECDDTAMKEELARLLGSWQDCGGLKPDR